VDRPVRVPQIYGYAICLVAVITGLISVSNFVEAAFARMDPLRSQDSRFGFVEGSLTSFEAYRATTGGRGQAAGPVGPSRAAPADTLSTEELRRRYEALRADRIARVSYDATQRLVKHGLLLVLALLLFATHWRWLQRRARTEGT
jgi:hypothetical protein